MTDSPAPIEDREANIRFTVQSIIDQTLDSMFSRFDDLKKRNINDDDVVAALRYLGPVDLLDDYAEWGDIDLREDDNTTTDPTVPDPGNAPSYDALKPLLAAAKDAASPALSTPALDRFLQHARSEVIPTVITKPSEVVWP